MRAWTSLPRHASYYSIIAANRPYSFHKATVIYRAISIIADKNNLALEYPTWPSPVPSRLQRRGYANFKRYTMDQSLINDLKSRPVDALPTRNGNSEAQGPEKRTAYIALGSNLGDRVAMIEQACREMDARGIKVKRTSSLWETEPMYVLDQDRFVNGVCEVCVSSPLAFVHVL